MAHTMHVTTLGQGCRLLAVRLTVGAPHAYLHHNVLAWQYCPHQQPVHQANDADTGRRLSVYARPDAAVLVVQTAPATPADFRRFVHPVLLALQELADSPIYLSRTLGGGLLPGLHYAPLSVVRSLAFPTAEAQQLAQSVLGAARHLGDIPAQGGLDLIGAADLAAVISPRLMRACGFDMPQVN